MKKDSRVAKLLGIEYPVLQAPMNWLTDAKLVAAVSNAGGLGILGPNAGGHMNPVNFGTLSAVRSAREVVDVPLIAAGGIVDGLSVQIAGLLGAEGVYCGSRFVACTEAPTHESIKQLYVDTTSDQLVQVAGIFGPVRSIHTPVIDKCLELMANPKENAGIITGTYAAGYKTAMLDGDLEHGLLDCGGAIDNIKDILSAEEIIREMAKGME